MPLNLVRLSRAVLTLTAGLAITSCTDNTAPERSPTADGGPSFATDAASEIFVGAGDIASCGNTGDSQTAALINALPDAKVFTLGDNAYESGSAAQYTNCYEPTWGAFKARTFPSAGNKEYQSSNAAPYFAYFGAAAGDPAKGYYSFDLGAWHVIVLNSNIARSATSPQVSWLKADLAAHPNQCTLAYWHHPLYSSYGSGTGGITFSSVRPFYDALYAGGAELVLNGHRHFYERMAPIKPDGTRDSDAGVREIIVGSGGIGGGSQVSVFPASEVRNGNTRGVLKLSLNDNSYDWQFLPVAGRTFTDAGSTACHGPPGANPVSASQSSVSASPAAITASTGGETSTITVTVRNASGVVQPGVTVTLSASGTGNAITQPAATDAQGMTTGTLSSTGAGTKTITAVAGGVTLVQQPAITVGAGGVDADQSTVGANPGTIPAVAGTSTITVTAKDAFGNPVGGVPVELSATGTGNTLTQPSGNTGTDGKATGSLSSTDEGSKTVSATAGGVAVTQNAGVTVTSAPPPGITHTLLTAGTSPTNQRIYTTAAISPAPSALVTVAVLGHSSFGAPPPPTVTGGGMSAWTLIESVTFDTLASPFKRLSLYRAMSTSPGSGPITITFTGTESNAEWIVSQWQGVQTSGAEGADAIAQTGTNRSNATNGLTVPLAAFGDSRNVALGVFAVNRSVAGITPGSGFTEISEQSSGESPPGSLQTERAENQNTIDATWSNLRGGAIGVEIRAQP